MDEENVSLFGKFIITVNIFGKIYHTSNLTIACYSVSQTYLFMVANLLLVKPRFYSAVVGYN